MKLHSKDVHTINQYLIKFVELVPKLHAHESTFNEDPNIWKKNFYAKDEKKENKTIVFGDF